MKKLVILGAALFAIFMISLLLFRAHSEGNKDFLTQQLPQEQWWENEQAEGVRERSFSVVYGVFDESKFLSLLKQAFKGDHNALLQVAIARLDDVPVHGSFWSSKREKGSLVSSFIDAHAAQLVTEEGKPLTEPDLLRRNPRAVIRELADAGHPGSAAYYLFNMVLIEHRERIVNDEHRTRVLRYLEPLKTTERYKKLAHNLAADYILFDDGDDAHCDQYGVAYRTKTLKERRVGLSEAEERQAIELYQVCASEGSLSCAAHIAEAYAESIGAKQDWEQAYTWAQIVKGGLKSYFEHATQIENEPALEYFTSIEQLVEKIIQQGNSHLSTEQKSEAVKKAHDWLEARFMIDEREEAS